MSIVWEMALMEVIPLKVIVCKEHLSCYAMLSAQGEKHFALWEPRFVRPGEISKGSVIADSQPVDEEARAAIVAELTQGCEPEELKREIERIRPTPEHTVLVKTPVGW